MNLEQLTLGAIAVTLGFVITLWGSIKKITSEFKDSVGHVVEDKMKPLEDKIDALDKKINNSDLNATKNFLVARIEELRKGEVLDETAKQRFYEEYEHYQKLGGNSYISKSINELQMDKKV